MLTRVFIAYLSGALISTVAAGLVCWKLRPENLRKPGGLRSLAVALIRVFAFWPCYVLLALVLVVMILREKRRHRLAARSRRNGAW
jgi:hypothetical protein